MFLVSFAHFREVPLRRCPERSNAKNSLCCDLDLKGMAHLRRAALRAGRALRVGVATAVPPVVAAAGFVPVTSWYTASPIISVFI